MGLDFRAVPFQNPCFEALIEGTQCVFAHSGHIHAAVIVRMQDQILCEIYKIRVRAQIGADAEFSPEHQPEHFV